ncbi:extensin-like [Arachis ipaensis]|uniref:extensin-like n=1 Tax=Arachis ipaensis TaxID=130454 RepID=UPI0007AFD5BC|nr:extensin-like [Arachis ipaensis]XP_025678347.1 extensin-like [Arachis hypogaea]
MRKKTILQKPPHEKVLKLPTKSKPSTRSQDQTFIPSPSPPTSPPHTDPMARTKNPSRSPPSFKPTAPPNALSKPSTSKGKRPAAEELASEPTRPKPRFAPSRPQRGKTRILLKSVKEPSVDPFVHKAHFITSHSNYNPHHF